MALQVEVDHLTKDELLFELQARGLHVNSNNNLNLLDTLHLTTHTQTLLAQAGLLMTNFRSAREGWMRCWWMIARRRVEGDVSRLSYVILRLEKLCAFVSKLC
jgi:hypothetical protein